jgi:hypothetical protein
MTINLMLRLNQIPLDYRPVPSDYYGIQPLKTET